MERKKKGNKEGIKAFRQISSPFLAPNNAVLLSKIKTNMPMEANAAVNPVFLLMCSPRSIVCADDSYNAQRSDGFEKIY